VELGTAFSFFFALLLLAIVPGPSGAVVTVRALSGGMPHAVSTTAGIISGDWVFISLVLLGLTTVAENFDLLFVLLRYCGAAYLLWLGLSLFRRPSALLFYLSIFPLFADLQNLDVLQVLLLYLIPAVAVGIVMLSYGAIACRVQATFADSTPLLYIRYIAGAMLVLGAIYVVYTT